MSKFKNKAAELKQTLCHKDSQNCNHNKQCNTVLACQPMQCQPVQCQPVQCHSEKKSICVQQPIIIQKKAKHQHSKTISVTKKKEICKVQPFVPAKISHRERKRIPLESTEPSNREIEIHIQDDKQCLKKLFKKIHKLTDQLSKSENQRHRLQLQLKHITCKMCPHHEKTISKLQADKYKLEVQNQMLKKSLKDKDQIICKLKIELQKLPKQKIKEVIIEKPVEVIVEVPRIVPGPQRVVQKIVQIPKYVEVEKKIVVHEPQQVVRTVEVPKIVQKPIYIDRPVYVDRPIQVQVEKRVQIKVPVQVPVQVPVYVNRPVVQHDWLRRIQQLQVQVQNLLRENSAIRQQNQSLIMKIQCLDSNIEMLRRHNQQKNRQVEMLLHNSMDHHPISPYADLSYGSPRYTVSTLPHPRMH